MQQGVQRQAGPVTVAVLGALPDPQISGEFADCHKLMLLMPLLWQGSAGCPNTCVEESQCNVALMRSVALQSLRKALFRRHSTGISALPQCCWPTNMTLVQHQTGGVEARFACSVASSAFIEVHHSADIKNRLN